MSSFQYIASPISILLGETTVSLCWLPCLSCGGEMISFHFHPPELRELRAQRKTESVSSFLPLTGITTVVEENVLDLGVRGQ